MTIDKKTRIGYVMKMYPRFSETFIVNEILAHESAGLDIDIFSLRAPNDGRFHESLARVRGVVSNLPEKHINASVFWGEITKAYNTFPNTFSVLEDATKENEKAVDIYQALHLAQAVRSKGITHLHAHFGNIAATVARIAAKLNNIPYSFTAHAKDIFHESVIADDLRRKISDAKTCVTVSDFNVKYLNQHYGDAARNVRRIYNGMDLARFNYKSPLKRRREIISVGRLVEKKGFPILVNACAILAKTGVDFHCTLVGKGQLEQALRDQINELGLDQHITMLGARPQDAVMGLVQNAAAFAAPCIIGSDGNRDGLPTVLLEAMALGTPCVSTAVTGIPEVLHDGETGLMVPQQDAQGLADALRRLLDESDLRVKLAENARQRIEQHFDIKQNTAAMRKIFSDPTEQPNQNTS